MRIIGGRFRRRVIKPVPGLDVRPTPDRLRETLFNILSPRIEGTLFVDAYAGTGAVGLEALSRGARRAVFIEVSRGAIDVLRQNIRTLGVEAETELVAAKAVGALARYSNADIVFLDPPYPLEREYRSALLTLGGVPPALAVVQHAARFELAPVWGGLSRFRIVRQGDNALSFFERNQ
jgi:16S rRNA (guanine(966)-N(2))-methyltransferase RsmD